MSTRVSIAAVAVALAASVADAHSWVHCSDYRGDIHYYEEDKCFGHPRTLGGQGLPARTAFGVDIGFNQQPEVDENGISMCHSELTNYDDDYPQARYRQGQVVTLAWPSKNHVAAKCTNRYIPDTALELFVAPFAPHPTEFRQVKASFSDDPHENKKIDFKGFQHCPAFCENMDKALCTGTFHVPEDLPDGRYTFQWRWEFNEGTIPYVSCFEAYVGKDVPVVHRTRAPTVEGITLAPSPAPTEDPDAECVELYGQCAGGEMQRTCCQGTAKCLDANQWYSQCRNDCPKTWPCDPDFGKTAQPTPERLNPTPMPISVPQTCPSDYGTAGQLKKAGEAADVSATLENGCDCAKFCTVFAPDAVQFGFNTKSNKCSCYGKAGKMKTNGKKLTTVAGSLPLDGFSASFGL